MFTTGLVVESTIESPNIEGSTPRKAKHYCGNDLAAAMESAHNSAQIEYVTSVVIKHLEIDERVISVVKGER